MKKSILCSVLCMMVLSLSKVFAIRYMDVKVKTYGDMYKSIVLYTRKNKKQEYFWSCDFMGDGKNFAKSIEKFLNKINGLTVSSASPIYKSLKEACIKYDDLRYADNGMDLENNTIYLFDYSPDNKYFQTIIKNLKKLSKSNFNLELLHSITIR